MRAGIWGANYHPGRGPAACLEYTSLINIRPALGNRSMVVEDAARRERIRELVSRVLGEDEELD